MPFQWPSCLAGDSIVPWCRGWSTFLQTSSHWGWRTLEDLDETWPHSALLLFSVEQTQTVKNNSKQLQVPIRRCDSQFSDNFRRFSTKSKLTFKAKIKMMTHLTLSYCIARSGDRALRREGGVWRDKSGGVLLQFFGETNDLLNFTFLTWTPRMEQKLFSKISFRDNISGRSF